MGIKEDCGDKGDVDDGYVAEEKHFRDDFDQFDQSKWIFLEIKIGTLKVLCFFHKSELANFDASRAVAIEVG